MDNFNTHNTASLDEALPPEEGRRLPERLEIHYTPSMLTLRSRFAASHWKARTPSDNVFQFASWLKTRVLLLIFFLG